jgi:citrate/tricarballylate utilization protein
MSNFNIADLVTGNQEEAARQMRICNACRYCEGLCAVFPAMEQRRTFDGNDVDFLSNLCHNCGACYYACQYAPPHEFAINVPTSMAKLRDETYGRYAWPKALGRVFTHNELWVSLAAVIAIAAFLIGLAAWHTGTLFAIYKGPGAFYRLMPHNLMIIIFGIIFVYAIVAISMSVRRFWQAPGAAKDLSRGSIWQAMRDAASLRYLDGGGEGCMNDSERPARYRKFYHHATFYGFILCFASTCLGTLFHYAGSEAPYPLWHPVVLLGMVGGVGLLIGPVGLMIERGRRDAPIRSTEGFDLGLILIFMLFLTSLSGLALMAFRATPAMGVLLAVHLGIVLALFASLPYGKFVHGAYRLAALVRYTHEQRISNGQ